MLEANSERAAPSPYTCQSAREALLREPIPRSEQTLLIVEDDVDVMLALNTRLALEGYHTIPTPDGHSALAVSHHHEIHGVILDINLPGLDGWKVLDKLACPRERVFVITASRQTEFRAKAERAGCFGFMEKPFTGAYLVSKVNEMMAGAHA